MTALDGSEMVELWQQGVKIMMPIRSLTRKLFIVASNASTSYRVKPSDIGTRQRMTSGSAITIVIPDETSRVIFEDGDTFEVEAAGSGQITAEGESGSVTVNAAETLHSAKQFAVLQFTRNSLNNWTCCGYQEAAS